MKAVPTFEQFKKTFTNGVGKVDRRMFDAYGTWSYEEAYPKYVQMVVQMFSTNDKIAAFEKFLDSQNAQFQQSNISESRYYNYNGMKYRFSNHVYPTGSMTSENCIDFAANPEMIHDITF
jgi:hypothetical protein